MVGVDQQHLTGTHLLKPTASLIVDPRYAEEFRQALLVRPPVQVQRAGQAPTTLPEVRLPPNPALVDDDERLTLLGSTPHRPVELLIDVSEDTSELSIYRAPRDTGYIEPPAINVEQWEHVATFPSSGLMYPDAYIGRELGALSSRLITLYSRGRRNTRYGGVTVNWDFSVDRRTWTTNIDTVVFLRNLEAAGLFDDPTIQNVVEVGVGGGHIASMLASRVASLKSLTITDIILPALQCALRNISWYKTATLDVTALLGKGITALPAGCDLLLCNPPYIPVPPQRLRDDGDPYRGTGLIRELLTIGFEKADRIILQVSSMTLPDLARYAKETGRRLQTLADSEPIPLKIEFLDQAWTDWLIAEGGLERRDPAEHVYELWHTLHMVEICRG